MAKYAQKIKVTRQNMSKFLTEQDIDALADKAKKHLWRISDTELETMAKMFVFEVENRYANDESEKQSAAIRARILYYLEDLNYHSKAEALEKKGIRFHPIDIENEGQTNENANQ